MILYSYSSIAKREKKIYSIGGTKISSTGVSITFMKVMGPAVAVFFIVGELISILLGKHYYNVFSNDFSMKYTIFWLLNGIITGACLWYVKIDTYRLYEYLRAYLEPKKIYTCLNVPKNSIKLYKIKVKDLIKSCF